MSYRVSFIDKKSIVFLFSGLLLITLSACNNYLEQNPEDSINENEFYRTVQDFGQATNGAYVPLRSLTNLEYWIFNEMRSDNTTFQYYPTDRRYERREFIDYFFIDASSVDIESLWKKSYTGIARCNNVLDHLKDTELQDDVLGQYEGEVLFLRALYYFNLIFQFGDVPLVLESIESPEDSRTQGRINRTEVVMKMEEDLRKAVNLLPSDYKSEDRGRATSGAAKTLLAKFYMMSHEFVEAEEILREIEGYELLDDYGQIFDPDNKYNAEIIFAIQYSGSEDDPSQASDFLYQFAPNTSGNYVTGDPDVAVLNFDSGWNIPTRDMVESYEKGDDRMDFSMKLGFDSDEGFVEQPFVSKFNFGFNRSGQTSVNFPTFRYGDVVLMLAESINENHFEKDGEALHLINQIRRRASLPTIEPSEVQDKEEMRNLIMNERRSELAFENHRWFDLIRYGKAVEIMNEHGQHEIDSREEIPANSFNITEADLLLPIPQWDIDEDDLEQNPM